MIIKNSVSLSIQEAVELLAKIADSLEHKGEFAFDLKGQEASIEAGEMMDAQVSISPDTFSLVFNWGQTEETSTKTEEEWQAPAEKSSPVSDTDQSQVSVQPAQAEVERKTYPVQTPRRALPDRMALNTTTLPLDAGYWAPAFTHNGETEWRLVQIQSELENKKWASDDQIMTLSDLTPDSAKPKTKRSRPKDDDDLFSELDNLDESGKKPTPSKQVQPEEKEPIQHDTARPAARVASIPKPSRTSPPKATPGSSPSPQTTPQSAPKQASSTPSSPASLQSSIPKPKRRDSDWQEPKAKDNTSNDDWVRPSQVLKQKASQEEQSNADKPIPSPKSSKPSSVPSSTAKRDNIPVPSSRSSGEPKSSQEQEDVSDEVKEWKEPSPDENATNDDWVRPSEFLKNREEDKDKPSDNLPKPKKKEDAINRPPPTAPDKEKKEKDKKGWASWDD